MKTYLYYTIILIFITNIYSNYKSYADLNKDDYHPLRIRKFYRKAVNTLSQDRLYASLSYFGIGAFANTDLKTNDIAMEIEANYTISSFDSYFPYMNIVDEVISDYVVRNLTELGEINHIYLLMNLNYIRYVNTTNRFFKIFFENLPTYNDYLPFWDKQEKAILKKIINDPLIDSSLFAHNKTSFDMIIEDIKKKVKKIDPNIIRLMLTDEKIEEAYNIISSRTFLITLKGHKVIHNLLDLIDVNDIKNIGFILVPGADSINHESLLPSHPDLKDTQISYVKGKVLVKAGRDFKRGDEFFINYNAYASVYELFKSYGFVPIEALTQDMLFRNDYIDFTNAPEEARRLCLALKSCHGGSIDDKIFLVPKFTNSFDYSTLNIERLNYWYGIPFTGEKIYEIYDLIINQKHSNITEGMALAKFGKSFQGMLLYASNFRTGIDFLLTMYEQNEKNEPIRQILNRHGFDKLPFNKDTIESRDRFREILKYCMVNHHIVALNTREIIPRIDKTIDNLFNEMLEEITEEYS